MLGLGNAVTKQYGWSPGSISQLIGWWDFSDLSTMFQERDGTFVTPCAATSDPIGSIKNKAMPHNGGAATPNNRIGSYLFASSDSERPLLSTHPGHGRPQAIFDGTDDHLRCERDDGTDGGVVGGVSASVLSSASLDATAMTFMVVVDADNSSISTQDDTIFQLGYIDSGGSTGYKVKCYFDKDTQDFECNVGDGVGKTIVSDNNFGTNLQSFIVASGNEAATIYRNGTAEGSVSGSTDWYSTGDTAGDLTSADHLGFFVGESYRGGGAGTMNGHNFDGRICEIIVYNKTLSTREITLLNNYIQSKWYKIV